MRTIALAMLLAACSSCDRRPAPPKVPPPLPDETGTCETAKVTLERHGGCGLDLTNYVSNCHDAEKAEAKIGVRHPNTCVTKSESCQAAFKCK